jgi:uncharacterized protein (TIGR00725 family)
MVPDRYVAVVGAGVCDDTVAATAEAVGRGLAEAGVVLVCGGLGGVMEAACRGAQAAGGTTVGLLPSDRSDANPHLTIALATGLGEIRNTLIVRASDAVIAIAGEYGTLSEVAFALRTGRRVVGLGTWDLPDVEVATDAADAVRRVLA